MTRSSRRIRRSGAFTLVELLVVLVIMAIAAALIVPMVAGVGQLEAMSASRIIVSDLQYAQNVAITTQVAVTVLFEPSSDSYRFSNASGPLKHPMTRSDYVVDLRTKNDFQQLDIVSASFEGGESVTFDELGSPDHGGSVTVRGGPDSYRIDVAAVTGTMTVTPLGS